MLILIGLSNHVLQILYDLDYKVMPILTSIEYQLYMRNESEELFNREKRLQYAVMSLKWVPFGKKTNMVY